jgi:hypothetical protein
VEQSAGPGISVYANPTPQIGQALSVHQVLGVDQNSKSVWASQVTVYAFAPSTNRLYSQSCPPAVSGMTNRPGQSAPFRWVASDLTAFLSSGSALRFLASDVASFSISGISSQGLRPPLIFSLSMSRQTPRGTVSMTLQ